METYDDECLEVFLKKQKQLFREEVASNLVEAEAFLEDCMAVVCANLDEVKEYFEYFLAPDENRLIEKFRKEVTKELSRTRRGGYSKARISVLKRLIGDFESFQPSLSSKVDFMMFIFALGVDGELRLWYPPALEKGLEWIMLRAVDMAEDNEDAGRILPIVDAVLTADGYAHRAFRRNLAESLRERVSRIRLDRRNVKQ